MSNIVKGRMTAELDREIVVFLIGMRINSLWKVHQWWPVARAMPRMIRELSAQPELGFLHAEQWFGRTTIMVQYWQSFDHLETYAKNRDHVHLPAWAAFNRHVGNNGDVGIWHETYRLSPIARQFRNVLRQHAAIRHGQGNALGGSEWAAQ